MKGFWLDSWGLEDKENCMLQAVELARKAWGRTAPNPCVGAVVLQQGRILAWGWHQGPGLPHAEAKALQQAALAPEYRPEECALFVTLEPCNHQGRTPPCTRAVLEQGIRRVVVGCKDPNPGVQGGGAEYLEAQGAEVEIGVAEQACRDLISDFMLWQQEQRPFVLLKLASSLDGRIGLSGGRPARISGPQAKEQVHYLRSRVQAVLVGGGTFYQDDPGLDCRLQDFSQDKQPWAVVLGSSLPEAGTDFDLLQKRPQQTIFLTSEQEAASCRARALQRLGARIWPLERKGSGLDLQSGLKRLFSELSCYYVLCEGGGRLGLELMQASLADELQLILAPKVLGDEQAVPVLWGRRVQDMRECLSWRFVAHKYLGRDLWLSLRPGLHRDFS
ncbi:MAG: bifunctional diaminohydroxyphosphoribosylaminopyrimidine deaminase/5-amino-6-(5-phosphoribosylamino)uracil reductase RibD [Desulfohalobiaceae bacterium]